LQTFPNKFPLDPTRNIIYNHTNRAGMNNKELKIMIIDDSETVRKMLEDELASLGHEVHTFRTAEDGLFSLRDQKYDLTIIDLKLPGMGGLELLDRITTEKIKVIPVVMTGYESPESASQAIEKGAYGYIIKPVLPLYLNIVIQLALKRYDIEEKRRESFARRIEQVKTSTELLDEVEQLKKEVNSLQSELARPKKYPV